MVTPPMALCGPTGCVVMPLVVAPGAPGWDVLRFQWPRKPGGLVGMRVALIAHELLVQEEFGIGVDGVLSREDFGGAPVTGAQRDDDFALA